MSDACVLRNRHKRSANVANSISKSVGFLPVAKVLRHRVPGVVAMEFGEFHLAQRDGGSIGLGTLECLKLAPLSFIWTSWGRRPQLPNRRNLHDCSPAHSQIAR